jgi:hypothetical protein
LNDVVEKVALEGELAEEHLRDAQARNLSTACEGLLIVQILFGTTPKLDS